MQLGRGVKWRAYDDGIVAYVPATCETHILPPHFAAFFRSVASWSSGPVKTANTLAQDSSETPAPGVEDQFISELIALKILDAGN